MFKILKINKQKNDKNKLKKREFQLLALEALDKVNRKYSNEDISEEAKMEEVRKELELNEDQFSLFKSNLSSFLSHRPNPHRVNKQPSSDLILLVMIGVKTFYFLKHFPKKKKKKKLPGSGKSFFSTKIAENKKWERINQDELKSRPKCESKMISSIKNGKNVIMDRTNIDMIQRHHWISLATKNNFKEIHAIFFDISKKKKKKLFYFLKKKFSFR